MSHRPQATCLMLALILVILASDAVLAQQAQPPAMEPRDRERREARQAQREAETYPPGFRVGEKPRIVLPVSEDRAITADAMLGKHTILYFWNSRSLTRGADPVVKAIDLFAGHGVEVIGICLDPIRETMTTAAAQRRFDWENLWSGEGWHDAVVKVWGVERVPHCVIIGPDASIIWRGHPTNIEGALLEGFRSHPTPMSRRYQTLVALADAIRHMERRPHPGLALMTLRRLPDEPVVDDETRSRANQLLALLAVEGEHAKAIEEARRVHADMVQKLEAIAHAPRKVEPQPKPAAPAQDPESKQKPDDDDLMLDFVDTPSEKPDAQADAPSAEKDQPQAAPPSAPEAMDPALVRFLDQRIALADRYRDQNRREQAYEAYQSVIDRAPDSPQARLAQRHIRQYTRDAALMQRIEQQRQQREARNLLSEAEGYLRTDNKPLAKSTLQRLIKEYPDTPAATDAKRHLESLDQAR